MNIISAISITDLDKKKQELIKWLQEKDITTIGSAELARYNPPFIPGFLKRNEVIIEVNHPAE